MRRGRPGAGSDPQERAQESQATDAASRARLPDPSSLEGARRTTWPPPNLEPALASTRESAPEGDEWLHEIKLDGYRIIARLHRGEVGLITRNRRDWTRRFPEIASALSRLPVENAVLDGEIVAFDADGVSSFRKLQENLSAGRSEALFYHLFDLLHLDDYDLTGVPLRDRKRMLAALLEAAGLEDAGADPPVRLRYTEHLPGQGRAFHEQACELGLEGIVSKRADSRYRRGRSRQWVKTKCSQRDEFVVVGFTEPDGARSGFGSLLLAARSGERLVYVGRVGTGFTRAQLRSLHDRLTDIETPQSPLDREPPGGGGVHWVRPALVVEVEYTEWTRDGRLRHPVFLGLREDRDWQDVQLPASSPDAPSDLDADEPRPALRRTDPGRTTLEGIALSHPERVLYPEPGITKADLARHYVAIQDWILPRLIDRPLTLLRCPEGCGGPCFYQKHPGDALDDRVPRIPIPEKKGVFESVYVRSVSDLVALVQVGVLEIHPWSARIDDLERPDLLVFDLDPGPETAWRDVVRTARGLRDRLDDLGLKSFVRITGGKGLHLVVPLEPSIDWKHAKAFTRAVARAQVAADPERTTVELSKARRRGRIYIDFLRNDRGATAIASYSTRARPGAPVAVPIRWDELTSGLRSDRYSVDALRRRLAALRTDPWEGFEQGRRRLDEATCQAICDAIGEATPTGSMREGAR